MKIDASLANVAFDLALYTNGRFVLGLGSQVKPHIERRFSMPWSHPAPRMREMVLAMRAIWDSWQHGRPLDFRGDFYTHPLMTPFFSPEPHEYGPPPVYLAGVGERMTEVAGEVCDGFSFHPFTTPRYLQAVTIPAMERGRAKAGLSLEGLVIAGPAFVAVGRNEAELATAVQGTKAQIAFYASTRVPRRARPAWLGRPPARVDQTHQGGTMVRARRADRRRDDGAFAVVGEPAGVARGLRERYAGVADRIRLYATYESDPSIWPGVIAALR